MKENNNYDIAIIGAGPAGMMAAISSSLEYKKENIDANIILIEKNNELGRKLLLTGKGRCNITNNRPIRDVLNKYNKETKKFLKHSFYSLRNDQLLEFFEKKGLEFKEEDDKRIFPITDNAQSVLNILKEYLNELNVEILLESELNDINKEDNTYLLLTNNQKIRCEKLIITTGGFTYQHTGSSGDGYKFAKKLNHKITKIQPGLVPFIIKDIDLTQLAGLSLENIETKYGKFKTDGNVLISHDGLTGPGIIDLSNELIKTTDYDLLNPDKNELNDLIIYLDLCPNLNYEQINKKIIEEVPKYQNRKIKNYIKNYLPNNFIYYFVKKIDLDFDKHLIYLKKDERKTIIKNLKNFPIKINGINETLAKITVGGVKLDQINSKTLESKVNQNLYFAGEVLDLAGPTGGYNLQIAFTTGYLAGLSGAKQ